MISDGPSVVHLAAFVNGYPFKPDNLGDEGVPVVRIRHLLDESVEPERAHPPVRAVFIDDGDLVFSWSATLAVRRWRRGRALLNQHLFKVEPRPGVDTGWLRYVLEAGIHRLRPLMHGSAMTHITNDMLRMLKIRLPSLEEQRAVADFLDVETAHIDALVRAKRRLVETLDQRRRTIIGAAVTGGIPETAGAVSGAEPRPFKVFAKVDLGRARTPEAAVGPNMVPYLRAANVKNGYLDLETVTEMNFTPTEQRVFALRPGDVLVTEGAGSLTAVGANAVWHGEISGTICFQNHVLRLRATDRAEPRFIAWWARHAYESGLLASLATGAQILNLGAENVRALPVQIPSRNAQRAIADLLDPQVGSMEGAKSSLLLQMDLLSERRQALIDSAVSGQIEVPGVAA